MVGFLYEATTEDDLNDQPSKLKNSEDQVDFSLPELDDFSSSFADSFLDFDSIKDWMEEKPDPYVIEPKPEPDMVDLGKVEFGVVEKRLEMAEDGSCRETTAGDPLGDCSGTLGNLGSLIEEEMGKVKLECPLDGSVAVDGYGVKSERIVGVVGNGAVSIESLKGNGKSAESVEIMGFNGNGARSGDLVCVNGDGLKTGTIVSAGDKSDDSSESESESSSSSSSASSSSSDDDDDDDDDDEEEEEEEKEEEKKGEVDREMDMEEGEIRDSDVKEMFTWSDGEDEDGGDVMKGPIRSKNEIKVLPPVPPVNVTLQPYHQTLPVGVVLSIIGTQVIVEGVEKHNPLNEGSILWITENRSPLGLVDEIFGPVKNPYYVVRYNSDNEVPAGIGQGTLVSFVPEFVNHVLNDNNLYKKGYDASGDNDEELSDEMEFSDDEKEAEYRRMRKMTKRGMNDQKHENKKKGKNNFKNRSGTWRNGQPSTSAVPTGVCQPPVDQNELYIPPAAVSVYHGNCGSSFGTGQGFADGPGFVPPFPQLAQAPGFTAPSNCVWMNGMACQQQQQSMGFPSGYPTNVMPWMQQSRHQQSYNMPLPNGMPFQQQFDPSQRVNVVLPGGQSNFSVGPPFAPWSSAMGQSGFNQSPFGMGVQGHNAHPPVNGGEQGVPSNGLQQGHNCDLQPPFVIPRNTEVPQNFNQGRYFGRGKKPYRRGGGRFGGGGGRQQSK